jgi:hypothetical protein
VAGEFVALVIFTNVFSKASLVKIQSKQHSALEVKLKIDKIFDN